MITPEECIWLLSDQAQRAIAAARGRDPLDVAADRTVPRARLVATQVKYLARAALKLPSYAAAQCILPPRAFEQASSEACAAWKSIGGEAVLDLTCGLGVDALMLSRRFRRVVTLERDAVLADIARANFSRLGATNIEVIHASAEEWLDGPAREWLRQTERGSGGPAEERADTTERYFDWVYADPDRRDLSGRKLVRLEQCSPDIVALLPRIRAAGRRLCLKNSPLFDVDEALRLFPDARVEVVSLGDECKEVVVYDDRCGPCVTATAIRPGTLPTSATAAPPSAVRSFTAPAGACAPPPPADFEPGRYRWLIIPDVALQKARLARLHLAPVADIWSDDGYAFAAEMPREAIGRIFAVERIEAYDPRRLRRELNGCGATLLKRGFPLGVQELMRRLGLHPGDDVRLAFTKTDGRYWTVRLK